MAAKGWLAFLLIVLNLSNLAHPCDTQELRCQCIQISSDFIPLKFIKNVQVIPENIYCSRKEVIALLKNGKLICLDPKSEWVMALIGKITHRTASQGKAWIFISSAPDSNTSFRDFHSPEKSEIKISVNLGLVGHVHNISTWEVKARRS